MLSLKTQVIQPVIGIDVSKPGSFIDPRATTDCQNMEIKRGVIQKRQGSIVHGSSLGERIMGMTELEDGINTYLVRVGLTKVELLNKSTTTWGNIAHTALTGTIDDEIDFAFPLIGAVRHMVFTNGVDAIRKMSTSTDAVLGGTPPKCRYLLDYAGYLVLAYVIDGGTNYGTRVQWCDTGDPEEWAAGNAGSLELLEDSTDITGINIFDQFVAVHKENSIYLGNLVSTSDVFSFNRKETPGAIANGTIQNLPTGEQIFLSRDGIRIFNGVSSTLIDSSVNDELRDSMNPEFVKRATSVLVKDLDEYWVGVAIGSQEEPETVYKYNYRTGQVYKDTRPGLMVMTLSKQTDQEDWDSDPDTWDSDSSRWDSVTDLALHRQVVFGFETGVTTIRNTSPNDNGVAIDTVWDSKDFTIQDVYPQKPIGSIVRWGPIEIWAKGTGLTGYYSTDSGSSWTSIGSLTLSSDYPTDSSPLYLYFDAISSKIRFRFRSNTLGQTFTFKQFWITAKPREARK